MAWESLSTRLDKLPLILAGPILRRVERQQVTVWLAMKEPAGVLLEVLDYNSDTVLLSGVAGVATESSHTVLSLGRYLHLAVVTADDGVGLDWGNTYRYRLTFTRKTTSDDGLTWDWSIDQNGLDEKGIYWSDDYAGEKGYAIDAFGDLPTFRVPSSIDNLHILHASCRKPHGESLDAFPGASGLIAGDGLGLFRPQLMLLGGDQIYADGVADALLHCLIDVSDTLLGWTEDFPIDAARVMELTPGWRTKLAKEAGFKLGYPPKSHLLRFGEYVAEYLHAWSDVLWTDMPTQTDVYANAVNAPLDGRDYDVIDATLYDQEVVRLNLYREGLREVRRALANIPTLMICDDHEIADDWFLTRKWRDEVLGNDPGKSALRNGMLAYALCQDWGNTPSRYEVNNLTDNVAESSLAKPSAVVAELARQWGAERLAGRSDPADVLGYLEQRFGLDDSLNSSQLIDFYTSLRGLDWELLVLDIRTQREFPAGEDEQPSELIGRSGLLEQIPDSHLDGDSAVEVTLVVSGTPVIGFPVLEALQETVNSVAEILPSGDGEPKWYHFLNKKRLLEEFYNALPATAIRRFLVRKIDSEAWALQPQALHRLLARLAMRGSAGDQGPESKIVFLSGDVHYGFTARMELHADNLYDFGGPARAVFAQLTSSALHNEVQPSEGPGSLATSTRVLHAMGFAAMRNDEFAAGWNNASNGLKVGRELVNDALSPVHDLRVSGEPGVFSTREALRLNLNNGFTARLGWWITGTPDWRYKVQFIPGQFSTAAHLPWEQPPATPSNNPDSYLTRAQDYAAQVGFDTKGRDIVGVNNIGEVKFSRKEGALYVNQTLYWRKIDRLGTVGTANGEGEILLDPASLTVTEVNLDLEIASTDWPAHGGI